MSTSLELRGEIRPETLRTAPGCEWYQLGYDLFNFTDAESYRSLKQASARFGEVEALAFVGTWCGDTHDHLPGFVRILDAVGFPRERMRIYALDRAKTFAGGEELIARHEVRRLPTFILLRGGREIGRITEAPERSLLSDLAGIFG